MPRASRLPPERNALVASALWESAVITYGRCFVTCWSTLRWSGRILSHVGDANRGSNLPSLLRPLPVLVGWLILISAWGLLGANLNVNGPARPPNGPFFVFGALFGVAVLAAVPIGFVRRVYGAVELLLWAAIALVALELCYGVMMIASTDPTSDDTAVVGGVLMAVPLWVLLVLLLLAGWGLGRLVRRGRRSP